MYLPPDLRIEETNEHGGGGGKRETNQETDS